MSKFVEIKQMQIRKCNEITMLAAKMPNDKEMPKCEDGSKTLSGCSSEYCIALELPESNFVKIQSFLQTPMMTTTSADCEEDFCVAKCEEISLIAARHTK